MGGTKDMRTDHPVVINNHHVMRAAIIPGAFVSALPPHSVMTKPDTSPSIDEYLRERLMPVEGAIPHIQGIEMFGGLFLFWNRWWGSF
jgi:hypothetical protein